MDNIQGEEKMISLSLIGLGIVIISWILEFFFMGKRKKISPVFVGTYILGVGIMVYDGFISGAIYLGIANLLSMIVAAIVLGKSMVDQKD
jgi:uncharacterized membrane protein YedE/YeeE